MDVSLSDAQALTLVVACAALAFITIALDWRLVVGIAALTAAAFARWTDGLSESVVATLLLLLAILAGSIVRQRRLREIEHERLLVESIAVTDARRHADVLEERARLAREMHDVLAHSLSALTIQLERTRLVAIRQASSSAAPPGTDEIVSQLERAHELAARGLAEAREAVDALRGDVPLDAAAMRRLVYEFGATTGISTEITITGTPGDPAAAHQLVLYRTIQEALTNAARHAHPERISVTLRYDSAIVRLTVDNDVMAPAAVTAGHAIDPATRAVRRMSAAGGWGLQGLRERVALVGGSLEAGPRSIEGDGFRVRVEIPR